MIEQAEQPFSLQDFVRLLQQNKKQAGIYGLIFIIISLNLCIFLPAILHAQTGERMVNVVQLTGFALVGIVNVWFFYHSSLLSAFSFSKARLAFICLLVIVVALLLFVYYFFSGNNGLMMAFASSGSFLLPFIIYQAWIELMEIPEKEFSLWKLPEQTTEFSDVPAVPAASAMQVHIMIARKSADEKAHVFPVTASGKLKLGRVFEKFVDDQRTHGKDAEIQINNSLQRPCGWQFFEDKWFGLYKRNLNPGMSLLENGLQPDASIHVVRIDDDEE